MLVHRVELTKNRTVDVAYSGRIWEFFHNGVLRGVYDPSVGFRGFGTGANMDTVRDVLLTAAHELGYSQTVKNVFGGLTEFFTNTSEASITWAPIVTQFKGTSEVLMVYGTSGYYPENDAPVVRAFGMKHYRDELAANYRTMAQDLCFVRAQGWRGIRCEIRDGNLAYVEAPAWQAPAKQACAECKGTGIYRGAGFYADSPCSTCFPAVAATSPQFVSVTAV